MCVKNCQQIFSKDKDFGPDPPLIWRYFLHGLMNSHSLEELQLFPDLCHQSLYSIWTIIVAVEIPFQVSPEMFDRP
jgi:hypothetical protein